MTAWPADLVGKRVVLHRRAGIRDGRIVYSDVLGDLVAASNTFLSVRLEDGSTVTVDHDDVHRLRPVPPGRADVLALEAVAARGWPAPDTAWLGRWLLRAAGGWTRRANSALLLGDPGRPVPDALAEVRAWYAERGLPARLAVPLPVQAPADHTAARLGWVADADVEVLTAPVTLRLPDPGSTDPGSTDSGPTDSGSTDPCPTDPDRHPGPTDSGVLLSPTPTPAWEAAYRARGVPPVGRRVLTAPGTVTFASLEQAGTTVAIGRGVVLDGWLGMAAVEVLPAYRRRGFARRVMAALAGWGAGHGAGRCYVQVDAANAPALALYAGLGFTRHHRYRVRKLPDQPR
jgi:N-acetylglutamate synthase